MEPLRMTTDEITAMYMIRKVYEQAKKAYPAHIMFSYDVGRLFTFGDDARKVAGVLHIPLGMDNKRNYFTAIALNDDLLIKFDALRHNGYRVAIAEPAKTEGFKEAVQGTLF